MYPTADCERVAQTARDYLKTAA